VTESGGTEPHEIESGEPHVIESGEPHVIESGEPHVIESGGTEQADGFRRVDEVSTCQG
jgi:hypothetical protein